MTITSTVKQLFPIVATTKILESFIVHRKPFYDGLIQSLCSPLTETSALNRFYTIAHRYDNIKVIELHFFALGFSCHSTLLSGLSEFPNNHFFIKFSLFKYLINADVWKDFGNIIEYDATGIDKVTNRSDVNIVVYSDGSIKKVAVQ